MTVKKILLLVAGDNGTIGSCSMNLYEALSRTPNVEVKCAILHHFEDGFVEFRNSLYFDKENCGGIWKQVKWLQKIKASFKPDVTISTLFGVSSLSVLSGGNDKKIGIFHSPHKQMKASGLLKYSISLLQYALLFPRLDKLCCVSEEVKDSLSVFPWIEDCKKNIIYNVHNLQLINIKSKESISEAEENKIFRYPTIVYCGRLDRNKAPIRALEAFAKSNKPNNAQLVFLGEDQEGLRPELESSAKELGIIDNIHFFGRCSNPYKYIKRATALISCSYSEGLPGVIIEALSLGVPVVATNSSKGIWEIFSALDKYNRELDSVFENECGFISSNLSMKDSIRYYDDIGNLSIALERVYNKGNVIEFKFADSVKGETIVSQLLSNMV